MPALEKWRLGNNRANALSERALGGALSSANPEAACSNISVAGYIRRGRPVRAMCPAARVVCRWPISMKRGGEERNPSCAACALFTRETPAFAEPRYACYWPK